MELSIIIPHYNSINYLEQLLHTIPMNNEIEIIIVDDKSNIEKENFSLLLDKINQKNIRILNNSSNKKGAGVCRNIGLQNASGKWILFADSDDVFVPSFFEIVSKYFSSDYDVIFFTPISEDKETGKESDRHIPYQRLIDMYLNNIDRGTEIALRYQYYVPWSKLIKASFLTTNSIFFDEVLASNDVMFSAKVGFYMKQFHATRDIIYCVTKCKGSLIHNTNFEVFNSRLETHIRYCDFLKSVLNQSEINGYEDIDGRNIFIESFKNHIGLKGIVRTYLTLRKNKLKVFYAKDLNPIFVLKRFFAHYYEYLKRKKYLSRNL